MKVLTSEVSLTSCGPPARMCNRGVCLAIWTRSTPFHLQKYSRVCNSFKGHNQHLQTLLLLFQCQIFPSPLPLLRVPHQVPLHLLPVCILRLSLDGRNKRSLESRCMMLTNLLFGNPHYHREPEVLFKLLTELKFRLGPSMIRFISQMIHKAWAKQRLQR